jgi:hypothetical protein
MVVFAMASWMHSNQEKWLLNEKFWLTIMLMNDGWIRWTDGH